MLLEAMHFAKLFSFGHTAYGLIKKESIFIKISMIVAIGNDRQIGLDNKMLWHIPEDFKHFKKTTMGKTMLMGRKTYESIGRPLPGRTTLILTRDSNYEKEGCVTVNSFEEAKKFVSDKGEDELIVCGGAQIYDSYLDVVDVLHLSKIDWNGKADTFFPDYTKYSWNSSDEFSFEATEKTPKWSYQKLTRQK